MYNPNVPSSNMGIAPISGQPSQPMGPTPMGPPPPMAPPMMGGMPPPPMMAPPPMAPPIAPITEGLGGFGGSSAGRAGFSERMQRMTAPPKPKPMPMQPPQQMQQPVQGMQYGGMVGQAALPEGTLPAVPPFFQTVMPGANGISMRQYEPGFNFGMPQAPKISEQYQPYMPQQGSANALNQYGEYLDNQYGDPQFEQKRDNFLHGIAQQERQTFGGMGGIGHTYGAATELPDPQFDQNNPLKNPQRNLGDSEYLSGIFGSQAGDYQDLANYQVARPMANGGSVPRRTEISGQPHMLAYINPEEENLLRGLGGSGQPGPGGVPAYAREDGPGSDNFGTAASNYGYGSSGNSSDSSYEDEAYGDDGYGRVDYGGGDSGGDGDEYSYLDDDYVYVPRVPDVIGPSPSREVVPEPESGDDDIKDRVVADLVYSSAEPTVGSSDPSVPDVAPDFGTFTDLIDPYGSLTGQVVSPTVSAAPKAIDAVGAAPVVGAVESGEGEGASTEVDVLGVNPISLSSSGITDRGKGMTVSEMIAAGSGNPNNVVIDRSNIPAVDSDFTSRRAGEILDSLNVARPGGSSKTRIEDDGLANAMAAAEAVDSGIRQNIADSFNNRSIRESEIGGRDDLARNQMLGGLLEMNTPEGEARMRAAARRAEILGMPADQQAAVTAFPLSNDPAMDAPAGDINPFIGITDVEAAANSAPPSDIQLEVAPYNSGNLTSGNIAELLENTPGLTEYALTRGSSASPGTPATGLTKGAGSGFNRPTGDPYAGDIVTTDVRTDLGIGTPYYRVGDPIDETTQKMLDGSPLKSAMLGESLTPTDVTFLNSPEMNIFASTDPAQTVPAPAAPAQTVPAPADPVSKSAKYSDIKGDEIIVPAKYYAESDYKSPGVLDDYVDPYEDQYVKDSYEQQLFGDPPKTVQAFGGLVKLLSGGLIDINKLTAEHRRKGLKAYLETNELAYENGVVVGVKDADGNTIRLGPQSPKEEDNIGGDDDGCPPGFRKINGVCMPIQRVAANPATAISDSINKATLPNTLRPIVRDVVDDEDEEEETSDVGGLTIRRPNYFAGGGAVSEGMGSAIDSFISAMGGSVKKKSNVAPVGMANGGYVSARTPSGEVVGNLKTRVDRNSRGPASADYYGDSYGDNSSGSDDNEYNFYTPDAAAAPVYPDIMSSGFFEPEPEPVKALGFQFDPRNANITGLPEIEDFMQRKSAEPYRSDQYIYNEMTPLNKGDITEGLEDNDFLMPEFMRGPLMIGNQYKTSVPQAAIDIGGEFFNTVKEDPLGVLGDAAVGLGKGIYNTLYDPPKAAYEVGKGIYDAFSGLGTETNARDRLGNIIGAAGIVPGTRALQVAGKPVANAVDAAQTAQAANFQSAISGTPVPNTGGIMDPRIETNLDPNESMLAQRIIGNAEQDLRSGMSAPEVMAKHDVAVYPQKNAAGETTGHEVMYRFDADRFKYDDEKFAKLPVGEQITLDDVTIESPFKNMGSDIQKNVTLENQKETRIGNLIKGIKEGRGPAGFFDDIHGGIARKTGTGTQIINYNEPQPNLIPHEILHATEQRALNRNLRDAMTGGGSQSKGRRINERIDDLKAQMKAGFPEVGSLEMRMAKMQDAKQEIAALKNISPEAAYMNNVLEAYARSAEGGVDRLGVYDMTRLEALNPKINQANILKRMAQGLGGKDSRAKYVPMTYEMIQGLNPVTTRADALTRSRFNNP